jgi:hypothetical protein
MKINDYEVMEFMYLCNQSVGHFLLIREIIVLIVNLLADPAKLIVLMFAFLLLA